MYRENQVRMKLVIINKNESSLISYIKLAIFYAFEQKMLMMCLSQPMWWQCLEVMLIIVGHLILFYNKGRERERER
jgi:hypothetical protein